MMTLRTGALLAAFFVAGCAGLHGNGGGTMPAVAYSQLHSLTAAPAHHAVTIYDDSYGDAVPYGITTGPDGALWFTDPGNDVIGRITTQGVYTLQQPVGTEVSGGITVGPDKNLWFTLQLSGGGIGRITPDGAVKLFADPGGAYPEGITTGPDGALWFAETNGTVGRITTKGKVTHFNVSSSNAELQGIVTGPDGALWITQYVVGSHFSNQVIRLTTKGKSTSYTVGSGPDAICVGSDGALWFTEADSNAIGRLTTAGKFRQYATKAKYLQPSGIAAGPDGALWFTDFSGQSKIGRITTKGKIKLFDVGVSEIQGVSITAGPDGAMWFTSSLFPAVGRITVH